MWAPRNPVLREYVETFVQPGPRYAIKMAGDHWRSVDGTITVDLVLSHLEGRFAVGSLSRWYPAFGLLDFDDWELEDVDAIRTRLGLRDTNSMLLRSEREDHYHLLFVPEYK